MRSNIYSITGVIAVVLGLMIFCVSCEDMMEYRIEEQVVTDSLKLKGAYNDGYFQWDRVDEISTFDKYGNSILIPLPWEPGGTQSAGIPFSWIDENANVPNFEDRMYSKENGWELVYSNLNKYNSPNKYFALYNKYTGIMRFFFFSISSSSGVGTTSTFVGMNIDRSSSLFNFTKVYANGINKRSSSPGYIYSPGWQLGVSSNRSIGFKENTWYGIEIECAYDPQQQDGSRFSTAVWAANVTITVGEGVTNGQISGAITSSSSQMPNLSLDFGSTTTNTENRYVLDKKGSEEAVGDSIEAGVNKGDPFFTGVWSNIKTNISKWIGSGVQNGVKAGIKDVLSSGGAVATKVLGNVFNSILGTNANQSVSKVELTLKSTTDFELESTTEVIGWGVISPFPLPASGSDDPPLYDDQLGVWNLKNTPVVSIRVFRNLYYESNPYNPSRINYHFNYLTSLSSSDLEINPKIKSEFSVENFKYELIVESSLKAKEILENFNNFEPYSFVGKSRYYRAGNSLRSKYFNLYGGSYPDSYYWSNAMKPDFKVRVSFDLKHKLNGREYSYSKYFNVDKEQVGIIDLNN